VRVPAQVVAEACTTTIMPGLSAPSTRKTALIMLRAVWYAAWHNRPKSGLLTDPSILAYLVNVRWSSRRGLSYSSDRKGATSHSVTRFFSERAFHIAVV